MGGTVYTFKRLLRDFAKPYTGWLVVGILAGLLAGGSLFGMLSFFPELIKPFEGATAASARVSPAPSTSETDAPAREASAQEQHDVTGHVERLAHRYGIPIRQPDDRITWQFMLFIGIGLLGCALVRSVTAFLNNYCLRWAGARVVLDLRNALFDSLQNQSLKFYGKCNVGELISKCTYDTATIENGIASTVADLARAPFEILAAAAFVAIAAVRGHYGWFLLALLIVLPAIVWPILVLGRAVKRYARRSLQRISDLVSRMQENFTGIRVIKAYHMEAVESARFKAMNERYFSVVIKALRAELLMTPLMEAVGVLCACVFLVFCYAQGVPLHLIVPMGGAAWLMYRPVKQLAKVNVSMQRTVAASERLFQILDTNTRLPEIANPVKMAAFTDRVVFDHVSFRYEPGASEVLNDLSFAMPRGSVAAFVGQTGAGKTTVANLVARFYDPVAGRVTLDGHDLRDLEIASLRRLVGIVTQETILFNDTIAYNISYGTPNATREQIEDAARKANAHDFIVAEAGGYERVVGDKGFVLSGGQRQRIAIARAILRNPQILILDEATSALDTATEKQVKEAIDRLMAERTVLAIAHRLSTIKHADQIIVLDKGRIVEHGTHAELYAAGGRYRALCDMQFF